MENRFAVARVQAWGAGFGKMAAQGFGFCEVIELLCILIVGGDTNLPGVNTHRILY